MNGLRQAVKLFSGAKPSDSYSAVAPVGLSVSTPSEADVNPSSRAPTNDDARSARARPRRRHGRRTDTIAT